MKKKITLTLVAVVALFLLVSCKSLPQSSNLSNEQASSTYDPFAQVPTIERGQDLLEAYYANSSKLTDEQIIELNSMIDKKYNIDPNDYYYTLTRCDNLETHLQIVVETDLSLVSSTYLGRIRCFKTNDVGIIIMGVNDNGFLEVDCVEYDGLTPDYLLNLPCAHYMSGQAEGGYIFYENSSEVKVFFPDEQVVKIFYLNRVIDQYDYPILGKFIGRSSKCTYHGFFAQDGDKVYYYTGFESIKEYLLSEGVESAKIIDEYRPTVELTMLDGTVKKMQYSFDGDFNVIYWNVHADSFSVSTKREYR